MQTMKNTMKNDGMSILYITVDVTFTKPLPCYGLRQRTTYFRGFLREFGVTAESVEEAKRLVEERVKADFKFPVDRIRKIKFDWIGYIPEDELETGILTDKEIVESDSFGNPREKGIWFCTGHGYYER